VSIRWEAVGGSDVGLVRRGNEDAFHLDPERGLFLVADGMGGHAAGEVASALTRDAVAAVLGVALDLGAEGTALDQALEEAVRAAAEECDRYVARRREARGMGTTLTACVLRPDGRLYGAHVGDSRAYRLRDGVLQQVTHDHTWVQREVDAGRLSPEAARSHPLSHIITRALGPGEHPAPDLLRDSVEPGDLLLLCTDGLTGMVDDEQLAALLSAGLPLDDTVEALVRAANENGGADNITAVVVRILPG